MTRGHVRRVSEVVSLPEGWRRLREAFPMLQGFRLSAAAYAIWPRDEFRNAQGAALAASRFVTRLVKLGLAVRYSDDHNWGYRMTGRPPPAEWGA